MRLLYHIAEVAAVVGIDGALAWWALHRRKPPEARPPRAPRLLDVPPLASKRDL